MSSKKKSRDAVDYNNRGVDKVEDGDLDGAIADFDKAIELDSHDVLAYFNRSVIKQRLGDFTGARADYDKAEALNPELFETLVNWE